MTLREEKFCKEYLKCMNGSRAAITAGYTSKAAAATASRLLTKVNIQAELARLKLNIAEAIEVSPQMLAAELKKLALTNATDVRTGWMTLKDFNKLTEPARAAIAEISYETKRVAGRTVKMVKVRMHNKVEAIQELNKMLGYNAPDKHELSGSVEVVQKRVDFE